jgi:hypothetical protein
MHQVGDLFELNVKLRCQEVNGEMDSGIQLPHKDLNITAIQMSRSEWHKQGVGYQLYATSTNKYMKLRNILLQHYLRELCNYSTNLISHLISVLPHREPDCSDKIRNTYFQVIMPISVVMFILPQSPNLVTITTIISIYDNKI